MLAAGHDTARNLGIAAGLFLLAGVIRLLDSMLSPFPSALCFLMTNFLYIGLAFAWGISVFSRTLHRGVRRQLLLGCGMAVLWLVLRAVKYRFFEDGAVTRHLWYLYYVPQILAPLFSFFAALQLGRREEDALPPAWYWLLLPAALLIGGILTNDLHQLAFRFAPGMVNWGADYRHGPLYFAAMAWMICLMLGAMGLIHHKSRLSESRRRAWVPLGVFAAGLLLCLLSFLNIYTLHKIPECFCLTFVALWESCIQVGLLPTNSRYPRFFSESTLAAQIADRHGQVLYRAKAAPRLTKDQMQAADQGDVFLSPGTRLHSAPVHDGHVYWVEDLTPLHRMQERLEEIHARLAEENELIRAEAEVMRQRAEIEEKSRLYDRISGILRPCLHRMDELLAKGGREQLQRVCILGAYVKRRGNLALICEGNAPVSVDELAYCIRESLIYLGGYGVVCAFHQEGQGHADGACLQAAYDFFEDCVEAALPALSALMVRVACAQQLSIRLMMEDAAALPDTARYAALGSCTAEEDDGGWCITLSMPMGGDLP